MALPTIITTVPTSVPVGDIEVNPITNRVYFVNPNTTAGTVGVLSTL
ncbi:MAG TPA: YVTN family beta-propeller repeat-containing protein, partial [Paenibacillus sp.]|nr:YVTN family beta-propeller repeat-containing protein [Paenibacillus sp.]